jgi:Ala-tRNA(Pro) deacylase
MEELLGVTPGSVTAFALMNDTEGRVRFPRRRGADGTRPGQLPPADQYRHDGTVSREDFEKFVRATGHGFEVIDFTQLLTEAP